MLTYKSKFTISLLLLTAIAGLANAESLLSVRFGSHLGFDRMVCELSGSSKFEVKNDSGAIELHLLGVDVDEKFFLPKLPSQIKLLTSVEAFREGDKHIVLEIRGVEALFAKATELKGASWRLAIDLSKLSEQPKPPAPTPPDTTSTVKPQPKAKPVHDEAAPYIPGDKPIETILADQHVEPKQSVKKSKEKANRPAHKKREIAPSPTADDSMKALETLAEFYDVMGDPEAAREYARLYLGLKNGSIAKPTTKVEQSDSAPAWLMALIAFVAGIAGGILGVRLHMPKGKLTWPKLKLSSFNIFKRSKSPDESKELQEDLESLDRAVASEKPKPSAKQTPKAAVEQIEVPQEVVQDAEQDFPADSAPAVEATMKESLMDRRVKRVLELTAENRSLADIAQELDMGQDEVKLILDLHS